ncbi:MAG TPA: flagellar hook-associated protein 3 [Eubacterium sp.]|nr:flagellar hook-associated protein 3 [Eubacterium sp.]
MRITNNMMINNSLANLSTNKTRMSKLDTQLATYKKISRPSDDPIIAIRALRFRTSLGDVTRYIEKNIPDAEQWMSITEAALSKANDMFTDILGYCTQGANDTFETDNRKSIANSLQELKGAIYDQGNVDYAGRYIFSGYKTESTLTFTDQKIADEKSYTITEPINMQEVYSKTTFTNSVDPDNVAFISNSNMPEANQVNVYKLAYSGLDDMSELAISYKDASDDTEKTMAVTQVDSSDPDAYIAGDDEVKLIKDTGELVFGAKAYDSLYWAKDMSITYDKTGFNKGEIKPEHYFTCIDKTGPDDIEYIKESNGQDITYNISYSQKIKVNTEASDAFSYRIGTDIDLMSDALSQLDSIENKLAKLKRMKDDIRYKDESNQKAIDSMIEGATKEKDIQRTYVRELFDSSITKFQNHQSDLNFEISDIGTRGIRLDLVKQRLVEQQANIKDLKSENEDIDLEEAAIDYKSSNLIYNASLQSASKVVRQSLLDFL